MVNVPPLLSSTPPPIDFGEEDDDDSGLQTTLHLDDADDYSTSEFGLVTNSQHNNNNNNNRQTFEPELNTKEMPPPDLALIENTNSTVEAFNYHVYHQETSPPTPTPTPLPQQSEEAEREEEEHVPSLKLDSLSLYSSESTASGSASPSTQSPVAEPPPPLNTLPTAASTAASVALKHQVTLEDVSDDDTDEECSPKKPKELYIREGADDFFAIELVAAKPTANETKKLENKNNLDKLMANDESFADFQEATAMPVSIQKAVPAIQDEDDDDDDFGDFADFSAAPPAPMPALVAPVSIPAPSEPAPVQEEDSFDDFQEFASPTHHTIADVEDDDDDFGDFSEPPPPVAAVVPPPPPPAPKQLSVNERIKPVLEAMFPSTVTPTNEFSGQLQPLSQAQTLSFGAIEQAQALNYQWSNSKMRHSLVRSLGIDSRNILFGEKWNSSMPRFAANLSFDPIKPLKTSTSSSHAATVLLPTVTNSISPLEGLEPTPAASTAETSQIETRSGPAHGEKSTTGITKDDSSQLQSTAGDSDAIDTTAGTSAYVAPGAAATLSTSLSANGYANDLNGSEQLHQQSKQFALRGATPSPPPLTKQEEIEIGSSSVITNTSNNSTSYALPLKETHIYTPSKSDTAVAKTTTLAPIDFDFEIASAGIIIDETVVKKEYRDVEYKPPFGLDSPNKLNAGVNFEMPPAATATSEQKEVTQVVQEEGDNDDFSEFQSMPAPKPTSAPPRNGTPTFGEQMILSPAILLPQAIPLAQTAIQWGENALSNINADEMARIEELFSAQAKPPTISATVAKKPPQSQSQQEDDEWSDFVSAPVHEQQSPSSNNNNNINNNVNGLKKPLPPTPAAAQVFKDDDWSDFVSSTPLPAPPAPAAATVPPPQFNSGAWQSANFYNNPLSLYQQQLHTHSNLVSNSNTNNISNRNRTNNSNTNYNNNNNVPATPQQIHIMHDFSTAPSSQPAHPAIPTYQQQHQRQQFQIGNAKVAPRISLIPDLSFVAPALPTNAGAFMSALPKPSFSAKK